MKKFVVGFFLILSLLFIGFISGGTIAKFFFIKAGDGLAGAATAAMLGFFGVGIGLAISIVLMRKLNEKAKLITTIVLTLFSVILWGIFHYQFKQRQKEKQQENVGLFGENRRNGMANEPIAMATKPAPSAPLLLKLADGTEMGIGLVSISPEDGKVLRFYSKPKHFELPENLKSIDSLTFKAGQHYVDIATAPPWFVPQYMKLDYGILQLVAVTVQQNWIEVIVNRSNGQTSWIYRQDVGYSTWSEFLLTVHSVELLNPSDFPPRIKPMDHASPDESVDANGIFYPISVKDDWLQVHPDKEVDHDIWVRWKRDGILLVRYSLLS
ncbi:MAG: hypothetical protein K9J17_11015 [Flavobacteriales bacterium]|nr:hypothetical protein [Flavobacteriales bacterium]